MKFICARVLVKNEIYIAQISTSCFFKQTEDRKSTRLNSSHTVSSYAVFCLKTKRELSNNKTLMTSQRPPRRASITSVTAPVPRSTPWAPITTHDFEPAPLPSPNQD